MDTTDAHTPGSLRVGWIGAGRMGAAMAVAAGEGRRGRHRLEPHPGQGRGAHRGRAARSPTRSPTCAATTWSSRWSPRRPTSSRCSSATDGLLADPDHVPGCVVDCSTVSTESSAAMRAACAERGVAFLASPVSGNGKVVRAGGLSLVVSGPEETYQRVAPLLDHLGKGATYVGEGELARLAKICHNLMLGVVTQCLAEITVLAEKGGMSRAAFLEFLNNSVMGSVFTTLQVAGVRAPRLHADLHPDPAAQGLRPRVRGRPRARRTDAGGGRRGRRRAGAPSAAAGSTRTSRSCSTSRRSLRARAQARGHPGRRRPVGRRRGLSMSTPGRPLAAPGHMGVDYEERVDFDRLRRYRHRAGPRRRWRPASAGRSCSSTSTTSATRPRPGSAARSATR